MKSEQASHTYDPKNKNKLNEINLSNTSTKVLNTSIINQSSNSIMNTSFDEPNDLFYEIKKKKGENIKFRNYSNRKDLLIKNQSNIISYIEPEEILKT